VSGILVKTVDRNIPRNTSQKIRSPPEKHEEETKKKAPVPSQIPHGRTHIVSGKHGHGILNVEVRLLIEDRQTGRHRRTTSGRHDDAVRPADDEGEIIPFLT
jgi:hypothetical protein